MGESKLAGLRKRIGTSGLIGAGIGLVYTPISIAAIRMAYTFEGNTLVEIITLPALPFFLFAAWIDIDVIELPGSLIPVVLFTAVGAGIGASVHWLKKRIKKNKG